MRVARAERSPSLALDGRLYAIGGRDHSVQIAVPEVYDPGARIRWTTTPRRMPAPRNHVAGYVDGALVCVAGGRTPRRAPAIDCFDPATSTWATPGDAAERERRVRRPP